MKWSEIALPCPTSLRSHGLALLAPLSMGFSGQSGTGSGCHFFSRVIFLTPGRPRDRTQVYPTERMHHFEPLGKLFTWILYKCITKVFTWQIKKIGMTLLCFNISLSLADPKLVEYILRAASITGGNILCGFSGCSPMFGYFLLWLNQEIFLRTKNHEIFYFIPSLPFGNLVDLISRSKFANAEKRDRR